MKDLEAAVAQIQEGAKAVLVYLGSLSQREHDLIALLEGHERKASAADEHVRDLLAQVGEAEKKLAAANEAQAAATRGALEKADLIIQGGRDEAKRLIAEANDVCKKVVDLREAARAEYNEAQAHLEAARTEYNDLKAKIAQAKENFLKA